MMRVIVTGAASFIGSAVVSKLLDCGYDVCAIVRPASKSTAKFKEMIQSAQDAIREKGHIQVIELDLGEIDKLPEILLGDTAADLREPAGSYPQAWDAFLHAGWEGAGSENREKEDVQHANVGQSIAALRAAAALGCKRFVFTGSQAEYGNFSGPASEDAPTSPISPYGRAKVEVSKEAIPLSKELGIDYVHARLYSIYGPGDHDWSLINSCLRTWKRGEVMDLGPCRQLWNFLYIDDAAQALLTLLQEGEPGFYNIASEDTRLLSDYIEEMAAICNADDLYVFGDRPQNAEGPADLNPDIRKVLATTSWRPRTSFEEGIRTMWEMEEGKL